MMRPLPRRGLMLATLLTLGGCSVLRPTKAPEPVVYTLNAATPRTAPARRAAATAPVLLVQPTRAAAGFDSPRILYRREAHRLDAFAYSEWAEPPARMLAPLLLDALEHTGAFRAVVVSTGAAAADYRLDTELVELLQDFSTRPSRVVLRLRATLVQEATRRVQAVRLFDVALDAPSDDPAGGVSAANQAVGQLVRDVAAFCSETVRTPPFPTPPRPSP